MLYQNCVFVSSLYQRKNLYLKIFKMESLQEKKFFVPVAKTYNNDLSKRWRLEWTIPIPHTNSWRRIVKYGDINKGTTVEDRLHRIDLMIEALENEFQRHPED